MGERLGTNSHSYVYVFKIGNMEYEQCCYSSECISSSELDAQYVENGCMIEVKLSLLSNSMSEGKTWVKESRYKRPQHLTLNEYKTSI